ncbi:hypothetical protein Ari01nite_82810 [Paractinoplanes rishiriensis]|uniref:DUF2029 domain-containing protein n=1 Tax=Paractinoplanes rishiriensis TaxID=1050105 RepID=A0A919K4L8_9ACTN|nr:hypothetical protein Ari01nite_82810 [Actinoplanes rishiriensis]
MVRERSEPTWLPALLVAVVTGYAALARPAEARLTDLSVYLGAVTALTDGTGLYDFIRGAAPFTYPPFAGLLFVPLTPLPVLAVQAAWTLATVVAVVLIARIAAGVHPAALVALALMLSAPVASNLRYGQVSLFLAVLVLADVMRRPGATQGVLIGVAAAVKLTPLIFIPMLWCGGRRRAAVTAIATFLSCAAAAWVMLPAESWRFWTTEVRNVDRLGYITSLGNQSLNAALLRWGADDATRSALVLLLGGLIVLLSLHRAAKLSRAGNWLAATVVVGAASVVFSPVSWTHHQVWLVLAAFLPIHRACRWAVLAVMLLPVTALGPPLWSDARLLLATAIATLLPIGTEAARDARPVGAGLGGGRFPGRGPDLVGAVVWRWVRPGRASLPAQGRPDGAGSRPEHCGAGERQWGTFAAKSMGGRRGGREPEGREPGGAGTGSAAGTTECGQGGSARGSSRVGGGSGRCAGGRSGPRTSWCAGRRGRLGPCRFRL